MIAAVVGAPLVLVGWGTFILALAYETGSHGVKQHRSRAHRCCFWGAFFWTLGVFIMVASQTP